MKHVYQNSQQFPFCNIFNVGELQGQGFIYCGQVEEGTTPMRQLMEDIEGEAEHYDYDYRVEAFGSVTVVWFEREEEAVKVLAFMIVEG